MYTVNCYNQNFRKYNIKSMKSDFAKVYCTLLAFENITFEINDIINVSGLTNETVSAALSYLAQNDLIAIVEKDLDNISFSKALSAIYDEKINKDRAIAYIMISEKYGYSLNAMLLVAKFFLSIRADDVRYIDVTLKSWKNQGITNDTQLKVYLSKLTEASEAISAIKSSLGIGNLNAKQLGYIYKWASDNIPLEFVDAAKEICIEKFDKVKLNYIDGILQFWKDHKVQTIDDLAKFTKKRSNQQTESKSESTLDFDDWQKMAENLDPDVLFYFFYM